MTYQLVAGVLYRGFRTGAGFGSSIARGQPLHDKILEKNMMMSPSPESLYQTANWKAA